MEEPQPQPQPHSPSPAPAPAPAQPHPNQPHSPSPSPSRISSPRPPANFPKCGSKKKTLSKLSVKTFGQNLLAPKPLTISIMHAPSHRHTRVLPRTVTCGSSTHTHVCSRVQSREVLRKKTLTFLQCARKQRNLRVDTSPTVLPCLERGQKGWGLARAGAGAARIWGWG